MGNIEAALWPYSVIGRCPDGMPADKQRWKTERDLITDHKLSSAINDLNRSLSEKVF